MASLKYTHAIVSRVPSSFKNLGDINLDEAKRQHENYVRLLRDVGLDVIELPPDESTPECVFVEDTAVVCNGIALITRPGNAKRLKEVETIRVVLKKELDLPLVEMGDEKARLDGGDVFFTGREFFVGLSDWTNEAGARAVAAAFPEYPCTPVKVPEKHHLKSLVTMARPDIMCIGSGKAAQEVIRKMEREATFSYQTITVPEDHAANVLFINGTLIHRTSEEIPLTAKLLSERVDFSRKSINISEVLKGNKTKGGLSSCCLLVKRSRVIRNL